MLKAISRLISQFRKWRQRRRERNALGRENFQFLDEMDKKAGWALYSVFDFYWKNHDFLKEEMPVELFNAFVRDKFDTVANKPEFNGMPPKAIVSAMAKEKLMIARQLIEEMNQIVIRNKARVQQEADEYHTPDTPGRIQYQPSQYPVNPADIDPNDV